MNNKKIFISEEFKCTLTDLWQKWTTHYGLKSFFGKDNFIELKLNGSFEIYFLLDNETGYKGSEGCKILSYVENEMLSFSWNVPPQFKEIRESKEKTFVVVFFKKISNNVSILELNHLGWPDRKEYDEIYNYFVEAWKYVIENLKKSIELS